MNLSLFVTIIGTIATLVFGFLSIMLYKRKKYPGKISFVEIKSISLFNNIAKNFSEIAILHNGLPIQENIIYIKGCFINNGDIDINGELVEKGITITIPEKYIWLRSKITRASNELKCDTSFNNHRTLNFNLGLIRRNEYFEFEALIEAENGAEVFSNIVESFTFNHRIANTEKIQITELISENQFKKKKQNIKGNMIAVGAFFLVLIATTFFGNYISPPKIDYITADKNGVPFIASVNADNDNFIELKEVDGDRKIKVTLADFQDKVKFQPVIVKMTTWQRFKDNTWFTLIYILLYIIYVLSDIYGVRKANKLYRILEKRKE